jgi:hypothetical protein
MYIGLYVKCPLLFSDFEETFNFLDIFSKNTQISNFLKIRPMGAELFHADGRTDGHTDMTKPIVAIRNFATAPKNGDVAESLLQQPVNAFQFYE